MIAREDVINAVFALLTAGNTYKTTGRRLILWTLVSEQPALFLRHISDDTPGRATRLPPRMVIELEAWIYANEPDPDGVPKSALNLLLDAVDDALKPAPGFEAQTLGGLVTHCWIEGKTEIHPGDLDGQAIAVVPIRALVPTLDY